MFFKKKRDHIKPAYEDRTYTIDEIRANYVPRKALQRAMFYNFICDIICPIAVIIALIIGFSIGVTSKCIGNASEKYVHEKAEEIVSDVYEEDK